MLHKHKGEAESERKEKRGGSSYTIREPAQQYLHNPSFKYKALPVWTVFNLLVCQQYKQNAPVNLLIHQQAVSVDVMVDQHRLQNTEARRKFKHQEEANSLTQVRKWPVLRGSGGACL